VLVEPIQNGSDAPRGHGDARIRGALVQIDRVGIPSLLRRMPRPLTAP